MRMPNTNIAQWAQLVAFANSHSVMMHQCWFSLSMTAPVIVQGMSDTPSRASVISEALELELEAMMPAFN